MDYFINGFSVTDSGPNGGGIGGCLLIVALVFFGFMWLLSAILPYVIMGIIILIAVILGIGIGMMDISGKAQDLILWGYVAFVGTYFVAKIVLWLVKLYRKTFCLWDKTIKKHNSSEKPILPPQ